ncbi:MAG: SpoVG family protein [Oscillospiraceae bacterium]|nr:SpoVG family protein [Oscillospiraceae bacterium]
MANLEFNKVNKETGEVTGTMSLEVRAYPIAEPKGNTKGFASVTIDGMFGAHGISIIEGKNGLFVSMPQTKDAKGEFRDIFHPVTSEGRKILNEAVLNEFGAALDAMVVQKESTLNQIRESAKAAKQQTAPASEKGAAGKETAEKTNKKGTPEH